MEWRGENRAHDVVYARIVGAVGDVESFRRKVQNAEFAQFEGAAQTQIENRVVGTETAIARSSGGTVVGEMIVAVNIRARQEIKRMATVVANDGRELKSRQETR